MKSGNGMAGTGTSTLAMLAHAYLGRWSGARRWNKAVRGKRGLSQLGRKADTPDGARGPAVALPADMETINLRTNQCVRWSRWRRRHQATARRCHYRRRLKLLTTFLRLYVLRWNPGLHSGDGRSQGLSVVGARLDDEALARLTVHGPAALRRDQGEGELPFGRVSLLGG